MKIGVLGGTFDPIHNGHFAVAEQAAARLKLAEVIFVPVGQPWLKREQRISPSEHRLQMVRLAIADKPYFKMSAMEVERAGPSYTVDTIAELRGQLDAGDELFFILGWGSLAELPRWREPARLIQLCRLVAVPRPGSPTPELEALESDIPGISRQVILLDKPQIDISASVIRQRVARGLPIQHLVPESVAEYITQHRLYLTR